MPDRDGTFRSGIVAEHGLDRVIETQLSFLREQHDRRSRELLGDRANPKDGVWGYCSSPLDIGETKAREVRYVTALAHTDGGAGTR